MNNTVVPTGWTIATIGDVCEKMANGGSFNQKNIAQGLPVTRIETISFEEVDLTRVKYCNDYSESDIEKYGLRVGDILFSHINSDSHLGKTAVFREKNKVVLHGINLLRIRTNKAMIPEFLNIVFKYLRFKGEFIGIAQKAVNQSSINQKKLKQVEILVPPVPEQYRIMAKLEELFSELDKGVESLKAAQQQLKVYRQAVLKWAFEGKFVKTTEWRVFTIKEVCESVKVGIVIKPAQYYTTKENGILAFRSANVREFHVQDNDWVYISKEGHQANSRSEIHEGDVLVVRSGYPGTACVTPKKFEGCNAIDILIAVPNRKIITPEFLCAYTNSPQGKSIIKKNERGVAQSHLNVGEYSSLEIPIPLLSEQQQILNEIESRLSVCHKIEESIAQSLTQAEALRQSILKKAFEGKLVPQDPSDEPADKLLERIRVEQVNQLPEKKPSQRRTKR